jgi:hypothetical protein
VTFGLDLPDLRVTDEGFFGRSFFFSFGSACGVHRATRLGIP